MRTPPRNGAAYHGWTPLTYPDASSLHTRSARRASGAPAFQTCFFFPVSKLRVPRPCVFCKGGYDADDAKVLSMGRHFVSESSGVSLWRKIPGCRQSGTRPSQNARRTGHQRCGCVSGFENPSHPPPEVTLYGHPAFVRAALTKSRETVGLASGPRRGACPLES